MNDPQIDHLKKEFIVNEEDFSKTRLLIIVPKILRYCKVGKDGQVILLRNVSTRKILKLIISARVIANALDKNISSSISRQELKTYAGMTKDHVFRGRLSDMLNEGFAFKDDKDVIKAKNVLMVEQFISGLEDQQV